MRYEIRAATVEDRDDLVELARFLDTVNLPDDPEGIEAILEHSERSFSGAEQDAHRRQYVFVLYDHDVGRAVGTSMVFGQLGRKDAPYIFLNVSTKEKYSKSLDRHFVHTVLCVRYSYDGPTEIGGLVMHPTYRQAGGRLGTLISCVRFLWIGMHREYFRNEVLAELLPPLEPNGTSHLWEALGHRFTHMRYREADRLSRSNKEFIQSLFPQGDIYATLLSPEAQDVIGKVGRQTQGVEKFLKKLGFRYADRVDPFDGGPHFVARTDEIPLVRSVSRMRLVVIEHVQGTRALVAAEYPGKPWFRAVPIACAFDPERTAVSVPAEVAGVLGVKEGDSVWVLPFEGEVRG